MLLLSLLSFDANDPSLNHVVSGAVKVKNKAGLFGAYTAGFLNDVFGVAAYLCPLIFGALGAAYVSPSYSLHWSRWLGFFLLTICLLVIGAAADVTVGDMWGGGMVGNALHINASRYLSPGGSALVWLFVALVGMQLAGNISWFNVAARVLHWVQERIAAHRGESAPSATVYESQPEEGESKRGWSLRNLRLPSMEFWTRWRDRLGNIQPTADSLP